MPPALTTALLLTASNVFMTFAWYGHLKFKSAPLLTVILVSWGIAFFVPQAAGYIKDATGSLDAAFYLSGGLLTAADLAALGVQIRVADYSQAQTLPAALAGVDRLLLVSGSEVGARIAQHRAVIDAAKAAGVSLLVYTSAPRADTTALPIAPEHKVTEELLRASGIPFTVLRNNWYFENYTRQVAQYVANASAP